MENNIRGWMTKINDPANLGTDLFGMELKYESPDAAIAGTAQYNGNISQQIWATSTTVRHAYGYTYDQLNQLSIAEYEKYNGSWNQDAGRFNEEATYDLNGNIQSLIRGGATAWSSGQPSGYGTMDNLTYKYKGNQLMSVGDVIPVISGNNKYDMADNGSNLVYDAANPVATAEYSYDVNGNMTQDKNKGITSIEYNYLNLPTKVEFGSSSNRIEWTYTARGDKLQKTVYQNGSIVVTLDYVSGRFDYKNGSLDFFYMKEGRIKKLQNGNLQYEYNITDHLGSARAFFADVNGNGTIESATEVLQESHYYAFGMRIEGLGTMNDNKFLFNSKELTGDLGLNWYEFGYRMFDAQLGRWTSVDPMDEFHSPYCFVGNNPINVIDPDGAQTGGEIHHESIDPKTGQAVFPEQVVTPVEAVIYEKVQVKQDNTLVVGNLNFEHKAPKVKIPTVVIPSMRDADKHKNAPNEYGFLDIENQIILAPGAGGPVLRVLKGGTILSAEQSSNSAIRALSAAWSIKRAGGAISDGADERPRQDTAFYYIDTKHTWDITEWEGHWHDTTGFLYRWTH